MPCMTMAFETKTDGGVETGSGMMAKFGRRRIGFPPGNAGSNPPDMRYGQFRRPGLRVRTGRRLDAIGVSGVLGLSRPSNLPAGMKFRPPFADALSRLSARERLLLT